MKGYLKLIPMGDVGAVIDPKIESKSDKIIAVLGSKEVTRLDKIQGPIPHYQGDEELHQSIESRFLDFRSEGGIPANAYKIVEDKGPEKILQFYCLPDSMITQY